jgi:hypothetical protein
LLLSSAACAVGQPPPLPTPSGAAPVQVAGVLLVPADPSLRASCARAAVLGRFAVPCPRLIIEYRRPVGCPDQDRPYAGGKDCLEDSAAGRPEAPSHRDSFTYLQEDIVLPGAQHLWIVGVKEDSYLAPYRSGCVGPETTEPGPELDRMPTTWVECPEGRSIPIPIHSGHVLLRWKRADVLYVVSLHGHTSVNREVEWAIARAIDYVTP